MLFRSLPEALGCKGWLTAKASTVAELEDAISKIGKHDGASYIEVMIPESESQPFPEDLIDKMYKFRTPTK